MAGLIEQLLLDMKNLEEPLEWKNIMKNYPPEYSGKYSFIVLYNKNGRYDMFQMLNGCWKHSELGYILARKVDFVLNKDLNGDNTYWTYVPVERYIERLIKLNPPK